MAIDEKILEIVYDENSSDNLANSDNDVTIREDKNPNLDKFKSVRLKNDEEFKGKKLENIVNMYGEKVITMITEMTPQNSSKNNKSSRNESEYEITTLSAQDFTIDELNYLEKQFPEIINENIGRFGIRYGPSLALAIKYSPIYNILNETNAKILDNVVDTLEYSYEVQMNQVLHSIAEITKDQRIQTIKSGDFIPIDKSLEARLDEYLFKRDPSKFKKAKISKKKINDRMKQEGTTYPVTYFVMSDDEFRELYNKKDDYQLTEKDQIKKLLVNGKTLAKRYKTKESISEKITKKYLELSHLAKLNFFKLVEEVSQDYTGHYWSKTDYYSDKYDIFTVDAESQEKYKDEKVTSLMLGDLVGLDIIYENPENATETQNKTYRSNLEECFFISERYDDHRKRAKEDRPNPVHAELVAKGGNNGNEIKVSTAKSRLQLMYGRNDKEAYKNNDKIRQLITEHNLW